jgi:hypothetical protein
MGHLTLFPRSEEEDWNGGGEDGAGRSETLPLPITGKNKADYTSSIR